MHDAKSRPLKVGDKVLIAATVASLSATEEYCNVDLETVRGRRPDGAKEKIGAINTGVIFRANEGDDNADMFDVSKEAQAGEAKAD